jgi:hypothetical protein
MSNRDDDETPFLRQPRTIGVAVVLLALLSALIWVVFASSHGSSNATPPTTPAPATSNSPSSSTVPAAAVPPPLGSNYDSACGLAGGTTTTPTDTPPDVTWQNVSGWYLPVSKSAGPGKRTANGPWSCFARTPTGAVLAAYTIALRAAIAPDFNAVVTQQTVPGVGQDSLLKLGPPQQTSGVGIPKGFLVDSYTNDDATIVYYLNYPTTGLFTCSAEVQWFGGATGDWLLRLESNGDSFAGCIKGAPSRDIPWGPTP